MGSQEKNVRNLLTEAIKKNVVCLIWEGFT